MKKPACLYTLLLFSCILGGMPASVFGQSFHKDYDKFEKESVGYYRQTFEFTLPTLPDAPIPTEETPTLPEGFFDAYFPAGSQIYIESIDGLEKMIERHKFLNRRVEQVPGWRVQIFTGSRRNEAEGVRARFFQMYPDMNSDFEYQGTSYKVRVGDFMKEEDAEKFCREVKTYFSQALLVKDMVKVPKYRPEIDDPENPFGQNR